MYFSRVVLTCFRFSICVVSNDLGSHIVLTCFRFSICIVSNDLGSHNQKILVLVGHS